MRLHQEAPNTLSPGVATRRSGLVFGPPCNFNDTTAVKPVEQPV